jgi:hypothetical protein
VGGEGGEVEYGAATARSGKAESGVMVAREGVVGALSARSRGDEESSVRLRM